MVGAERAQRFAEFLPLLGELLQCGAVTSHGDYYSAVEARNLPGCVQRPRIPFYVAANGSRSMRLAVEHGQGWVTTDLDTERESIVAELAKFAQACDSAGRDPASLERVLVHHPTSDEPLASVGAFVDWAGDCAELGFTELVLHWPVPESVFANDPAVFEAIATDGIPQLQ